ncbi:MAG: Heparinase family protein, partial [Hyphomicrobiales bacterium]|nr:Heparinase family protein [Hyphomicrobiales bacterium]
MDFQGYLRLIRRLPPRLVLTKAAGLTRRKARAWGQLAADVATGSHGGRPCAFNPAARIAIAGDDIPPDLEQALRGLGDAYLGHRFDLLGSGWVRPVYGFAAPGFLGHRYAPSGLRPPGRDGDTLGLVVNRSNVARASEIWRLISNADYTPIDWQVDVRSGYRWSARRPSLTLSIPLDRGADIKLPWELGRLQHLPQLALCAILADARRSGFEASTRYVSEISDQLADFIATNPPRFGVNWVGVMDVAIRAANIALTLALLAGAGHALPPAMARVVAQSLDDHADYVITHLEYSETGRSNHYLADLGGLIWANWMLDGPQAVTRLKFATAAMIA